LICGNYLLTRQFDDLGYAECYSARHIESNEPVRLYLCSKPQRTTGDTLVELRSLIARASETDPLQALFDAGSSGPKVWAVCDAATGSPMSNWLAENGRLPPVAVLQIARAMTAQLALLEQQGTVHGDISAAGLLINSAGDVALPAPGLRGVLRPQEGLGFADLGPNAYDYLAPERVAVGSPPNVASDMYACGVLWWQLLAGRPPVAGGNARAKLRAVQAARILDIRTVAQGVPAALADAMARCLAREPAGRPASFAALAEALGPPSDAGRALLASLQRKPAGTWQDLCAPAPRKLAKRRDHRRTTIGAVSVAAIILMTAIPLLMRGESSVPPTVATTLTANLRSQSLSADPTQVKSGPPKTDSAVKPASALLPVEEAAALPRVVEDLVLPTGEVLQLEKLDLEPRMRVRGRGGRRPMIRVPVDGLEVDAEGVTFEGIDFIWHVPAHSAAGSESRGAMIQLRAQTVSFRGCSFNARSQFPPAAIRTAVAPGNLLAVGAEVGFTDCVFDGMNAVVDHLSDPIVARLDNCLCVASGPILRLDRCPVEGGEVRVQLNRVTTRGDTAVLSIQNARSFGKPGSIAITADGCALAGTSRCGLIALRESSDLKSLVGAINWNGQGSVVATRTSMLTAQTARGDLTPLPDDQLAVAGLVRGELEFSGRADGPPTDSRVMRWQVPLRSADAPGADPQRLHSLRSRADE
jgi:serine/threonine protein kinase